MKNSEHYSEAWVVTVRFPSTKAERAAAIWGARKGKDMISDRRIFFEC